METMKATLWLNMSAGRRPGSCDARSVWVCEVPRCSTGAGGQAGWYRMQALRSSLAASRDCGVALGPAISWTSEKGAMSPNPQRWAKEKLVGRSGCAWPRPHKWICKKNEKRNGEERRSWDRKEHGAGMQGGGESSNVSFHLVKRWFSGLRE